MSLTSRRFFSAVFAASALAFASVHAQDITNKDLLDGLANPSRWLTHSGDYSGQRFSPLTEITPANAGQLAPQWTFQTNVVQKFEATPIVIDGVLYVTGSLNHAWAIDGRTGKQLWHYTRPLQMETLKVCCGLVNRGFAVYHDRLFMVTLDAHFVALEMKTGKVIYDIEMGAVKDGFAATGAPLIVKDKVIVGMAGGEFANRGFIDAYDPMSGQRVWRFYTIPAPGEPGSETWKGEIWQRGGGPTWLTGSYDPQLNLLYWGTGNPNPDWDGESRPGDNLYTGSLVALDPDTGKLKWHFQYTPHDTHDWDANEVPVLADLTINGRPRKVVMMANRNGFFYVNDRVTGEFLLGKPFVNTTWRRRSRRADDRSCCRTPTRPTRAPSRAPTGTAAPTSCRRRMTQGAGCSSSPRAKRARASSAARRLRPASAIARWAVPCRSCRNRSVTVRCARSIRGRASASGRSPTTMPAGPASSPPPAASSSAPTIRDCSSPRTR
jgi:alcohol dehydrogenase (cytochrome c)